MEKINVDWKTTNSLTYVFQNSYKWMVQVDHTRTYNNNARLTLRNKHTDIFKPRDVS